MMRYKSNMSANAHAWALTNLTTSSFDGFEFMSKVVKITKQWRSHQSKLAMKKKHTLKSLETKVLRTAKIDDKNVNQFIVTQFIVPIEF